MPGTILQAVLAIVLVLIGSFDQILPGTSCRPPCSSRLSAATLFRLDRRHSAASIFRVPCFPCHSCCFSPSSSLMLGALRGWTTDTNVAWRCGGAAGMDRRALDRRDQRGDFRLKISGLKIWIRFQFDEFGRTTLRTDGFTNGRSEADDRNGEGPVPHLKSSIFNLKSS